VKVKLESVARGAVPDEAAQFADEQRRHSEALATDADLQRAALEATALADRHNYSYVWRWLGVPIIQMPSDIVALQEIVWEARPQVIVETGVARGGSVIFHASMLELLGEGIVVGVDIDIRPHARDAIEGHDLARRVRLVEGSSIDPGVVEEVRGLVPDAGRVMVVLDSDHTHDHVLSELRLYGPLVTPGQFLVVSDTVVEFIPPQTHRPRPWGPGNNPHTAVEAYLQETDRFERDPYINGKVLMGSQPGGYLRCVRE
jgi:cephalosporin hydroxylase